MICNPRTALAVLTAVLVTAAPAFAQTATQYFPITPCRLFDSRSGPGTPLTGQAEPGRQITVAGTCGIPSDATAVSYNATIVGPGGRGFLTLYPAGADRPVVSALNFLAGDVRGNGGVVPLASSTPDLNIYLATAPGGLTSHVVLDASGYFKEPVP